MRSFLIFFTVLLSVSLANPLRSDDKANQTETAPTGMATSNTDTSRVYPIAPGVWYPGQPLPEKPIRYYRVRCWPGCHRGSSFGKYPREPLNMTPIFPTATIDLWPSGKAKNK
ncbi:MAG: hypothetical protein GTN74_05945 [Proteobacteria bacterium]|nr:hypothetical protein [Pseudomonadota bacterium]